MILGMSESSNSIFSKPLSNEGSRSRGAAWTVAIFSSVLTCSFSLFFEDVRYFACLFLGCRLGSFCKMQALGLEGLFFLRIMILIYSWELGMTPNNQLEGDPDTLETGDPD